MTDGPTNNFQRCWISVERLQSQFPNRVVVADYPHPGRKGMSPSEAPVLPIRGCLETHEGKIVELPNVAMFQLWEIEDFLAERVSGGKRKLLVYTARRGALNPGWKLSEQPPGDAPEPIEPIGQLSNGRFVYGVQEAG